ncbi:MAG: 16S rRNA (guanine(527)-N(7))-methyltransferase RsmG [Chloroflexota bacterium]
MGVPLSSDQLDLFERYATLLREGKRELSLTALIDPIDVAVKHFLDSLSVLTVLPPAAACAIDVGTGAGFPGVPLKIARPELDVTLLEATTKKADWVQRTAERLGLHGVAVLAARAEDVARDPAHRCRYDLAVARAVAPLPVLCELCLPFLRPGGVFVAQKSATGAAVEGPRAERALAMLGARLRGIRPAGLPHLPNRVLVVIEQQTPVPDAYPRRAGMPAKRPL